MLQKLTFLLTASFFCNLATAGLTVDDQLEIIFQSSSFTTDTSATVSGAANDDTTYANLIAPGDVVEMVFAFSGTENGDTDYAALLMRFTGSSEVSGSHVVVPVASIAAQSTNVDPQEGFSYSPDTFNFADPNTDEVFKTGSNNVAYLVTSDTFNFKNQSFSAIESNIADVNVVASYQLNPSSTLTLSSSITDYSGTNTAGTGTLEVIYDIDLIQTDIIASQASNFSTIDGTNSAILAQTAAAGKLIGNSFNTTDSSHSLTSDRTSLQFSTSLAVPEPSSFAVLGVLGIAGGAIRRRRK